MKHTGMATLLVGILLAGVPSAAADPDPADLAAQVMDRTILYAQSFNPQDNATAQLAKTLAFESDLAQILGFLDRLLCAHFELGVLKPGVGDVIISDGVEIHLSVPGIGSNGHIAGIGTYFIDFSSYGKDYCRSPFIDILRGLP
ncbi:MAG TPA: hypothetical protein VM241_07620 [Candidatus Thermoplasmatota archaeon]|nr:hypothetical protein [Candidatus Thermoplasmatota archaeon]